MSVEECNSDEVDTPRKKKLKVQLSSLKNKYYNKQKRFRLLQNKKLTGKRIKL